MKSPTNTLEAGLRVSPLSGPILALCRVRRVRSLMMRLSFALEGGSMFSGTARRILEQYYGVKVGAYSYGACLQPGYWPAGVTVGRYVSVAAEAQVFLRNHPCDRLSQHPFFYNSRLGLVEEDTIGNGSLEIGHDSWIGYRAMFTASCRRVGVGAVVGTGSVVTKDVPDFAVVAGVPAKLLRLRFSEEIRQRILQSRWWDLEVGELAPFLPKLVGPLGDGDWLSQLPTAPGAHSC